MIGTNQWQADTEQHARPRHEPEAEIAVHVGHAVHRERDENSAGDDQIFGLHLGCQTADDEHHCHGDHAAGREYEPRPGGGVAEILLHQLWQELRGREHHQEAGAELAACYHPKVDQALQR
jgi:hypothetical protein